MSEADLPVFDARCPARSFPIQIGGRWTAMILRCVAERPCRFGELRRHLTPISAKVLSETLATMVGDGFLTRVSEGDGTVTYTISARGRSLIPVIDAARVWAADHLDDEDGDARRTDPI